MMVKLAAALLRLHLQRADIEQVDVVRCEDGVSLMLYWYAANKEGVIGVE
jgi:hypothetical protein